MIYCNGSAGLTTLYLLWAAHCLSYTGTSRGVGTQVAGVCSYSGWVVELSEKLALPGTNIQHTWYSEVNFGIKICLLFLSQCVYSPYEAENIPRNKVFSFFLYYRQLPNEYKMFSSVDKSWKDIMRRVEDRPNALRSAIAPGTLDTLQQANASLEKIHKCLEVCNLSFAL